MRHPLILIFAFAALSGSASAASCTPPDWRVKPSPEQMISVWPHDALLKGEEGNAEISCTASVQGALRDCVVVSESPKGANFGQAALSLAPQLLMRPKTCDGRALEGRVNIPISFRGLSNLAPGSRLRDSSVNLLGPTVVSRVPWIEAPTYAQVVANYPERARRSRMGGHVALNCTFDGDGGLGHCETASDTPGGYGFADAAKRLAKVFRCSPIDNRGVSLRGDTTVVAFTFDAEMLSSHAPVIGKPNWTRVPAGVDMAAAFPAAATAAHVAVGHVTMACDVGAGGRLTGCTVTAQSPEGMGFDKAALALSTVFQVTVWTEEGLPTVGGHVVVPIRYETGAEP